MVLAFYLRENNFTCSFTVSISNFQRMKSTFLTLVTALFISSTVTAQAPAGLQGAFGVPLVLATGDLAKTNTFGLGFDLQVEYGFSRKLSLTANGTYVFFLEKSKKEDETTTEQTLLPRDNIGFSSIVAGPRFYFRPNLFVGVQAGYGAFQDGFFKGKTWGGFNYKPQIGLGGGRARGQLVVYYSAVAIDGTSLAHFGISMISRLGSPKEW